jgi:hypothetical protein
MKINIFTAADYVDMSSGKITIVGVFDNIEVDKCPTTFKPFGIAIKILCEAEDRGKTYKGELVMRKFNDKKAIVAVPIVVKFPVGLHKKIQSITVGANMVGVRFDSFGKYLLELKLRNRIIDTIKLKVVQKDIVAKTAKAVANS